MKLKGVLIDLGDTLGYIDKNNDTKYREVLLSILTRHDRQVDLSNLTLVLDAVYGKSSRGEVKDFEEFWKLVLTGLNVAADPQLMRKLEDFRGQNYASMFSLYEGTRQVLGYLRKKYTLALVSNCSLGMRNVISSLGIDRFFKAIILSYEVGVRKPDKRIYIRALQSVDLMPKDCIFVADEISDLEAAKEVGLETLLVRQGSHTTYEAKDPDFTPDFQCNSICDVMKLL